jgi:large-conductance mechanosensitive channel
MKRNNPTLRPCLWTVLVLLAVAVIMILFFQEIVGTLVEALLEGIL